MIEEAVEGQKMGKKRIWMFLALMFLALALAVCGNRKEEKEKAKIREVAQKYFDALKVGDQEGVYGCYLPIEREKRDAESGILGLASKLILKVDITEVLSGFNTLFGGKSDFANYKYKASDVDLDEEGEEAIAYVGMYQEKEWVGNLRIDMTRYGGDWYVVKDSVAYDDRVPEEGTGEDSGTDESQEESAGQMWLFGGIAVCFVAAIAILLLFLRSRGGRKQAAGTTFTDFGTPGGGVASGDILCGCGTVNPAGIRTCMGCGKKLKRRR